MAKKVEKQEIAASRDGRDIARGWLSGLQLAPVDDTILLMRGGGDYRLYDEVIRDDTVRAAVNQRVHGVISRPWQVQPGGKRAMGDPTAWAKCRCKKRSAGMAATGWKACCSP